MRRLLLLCLSTAALACAPGQTDTPDANDLPDAGATTDAGDDTDAGVPTTYSFASRFDPTKSSVAYNGQTFRHVLVSEMKAYVGALTARIDAEAVTPSDGDIVEALDFYFSFKTDTTNDDVPLALSTTPGAAQRDYGDFPSKANLKDKIAGNDAVGQHKDFKSAFTGWPGITSAEGFARHLFGQLEQLAIDRANGTIPKDPSGQALPVVYVTADGVDLRELLQKYLDGAIAFSQGTDDYLDDDVEANGLLSDNVAQDGTNPWTKLEHQWDEGFGYFGAARNYGDYTDDEIAAAGGRDDFKRGYHDTNQDGSIDFLSEFNFGHSTNAAKRDRGSAAAAKTDFTAEAWNAFLQGRALIANAGGNLSEAQLATLKGHRDVAVLAWEKAIGSTIVHYINDVLRDMGAFGTEEYKFLDHAKHWSELKGFALALQFNPRSPVSDAQFETLHALLGTAPVLATASEADRSEYAENLRTARTILADAYDFDPANVGDDDGRNGW